MTLFDAATEALKEFERISDAHQHGLQIQNMVPNEYVVRDLRTARDDLESGLRKAGFKFPGEQGYGKPIGWGGHLGPQSDKHQDD